MDAEEAGAAELECGICCQPYDRRERAPRRLGPAHGAWRRPAPCRHVLCTACLCRLASHEGWEEVTCPYCRTVTSLRMRRGGCDRAGGRSSSRRRCLALPPVDSELWKRIGRWERGEEETPQEEAAPGDDVPEEANQSRLWRALKKLLRGGGSSSARRRQPINPYAPEMKDLVLMTCYIM
ncbi:RING finger protein 227 [Emydura macquarii macquarii]|uniref:RING finger protein 227 n=1 Tax=Emydura macquarii macquarii TaxID=1129001 RepID=UPI00352A7EA4